MFSIKLSKFCSFPTKNQEFCPRAHQKCPSQMVALSAKYLPLKKVIGTPNMLHLPLVLRGFIMLLGLTKFWVKEAKKRNDNLWASFQHWLVSVVNFLLEKRFLIIQRFRRTIIYELIIVHFLVRNLLPPVILDGK